MRLRADGIPILDSFDAQQAASAFAEQLAATIYPRLPRFVRLFLSLDTLGIIIGFGIRSLANKGTASNGGTQSV